MDVKPMIKGVIGIGAAISLFAVETSLTASGSLDNTTTLGKIASPAMQLTAIVLGLYGAYILFGG